MAYIDRPSFVRDMLSITRSDGMKERMQSPELADLPSLMDDLLDHFRENGEAMTGIQRAVYLAQNHDDVSITFTVDNPQYYEHESKDRFYRNFSKRDILKKNSPWKEVIVNNGVIDERHIDTLVFACSIRKVKNNDIYLAIVRRKTINVKRKGEIIRKEQTLIEPLDDEIPISEASDLVVRYKLFYLTGGETDAGTDFKAVMESAYQEKREAMEVKLSRSTNDGKHENSSPSSHIHRKKIKRKMAVSPLSLKPTKPLAKGRRRSSKGVVPDNEGCDTDDSKTDPEVTNRAAASAATTTTREKFDSSSNIVSRHRGKLETTPYRKKNRKRNYDISYSPMSFKNTFHVQPSTELATILHSVEDLSCSDDDMKRKI